MSKRTLARGPQAGWAHPYTTGPFSSVFYADGGDGEGSDSSSDDGDAGQADDSDDTAGGDDNGQQADDEPDEDRTDKSAKKDTSKAGQEDPAAKIARLERELKSANAEAGKARTTAKQQAADEARTALVQELGKTLGLIKDEKSAPPDPAQLQAHIEQATAAHRETAIELAVFKGASRHSADPTALTDSRAFMTKLGKLDPSADDFTKKVNEAIKQAVTDNPKLKAAGQAPASSSGDFTGGTGEPDHNSTGSDIDKIRAERRKRRAG